MPRTPVPIDPHVRIAAILHIVMAGIGLLALLAIGAMVAAFGALGTSIGVEREVAAAVGGVGMIVIALAVMLVVTEIVGAVLLLRGSDTGCLLTIVFSGLSLLNIPIGTAIGAYALWALLRELPKPVPAAMAMRPGAARPS